MSPRKQTHPDDLTSEDFAEMRRITHETRRDEGYGGQCYQVSEALAHKHGWDMHGGIYHSKDGHPIGDHGWNVHTPTGTIIDATADQHGEGRHVKIVKPGTPEHARYRQAETQEQEEAWLDQARERRNSEGDYWWAGGIDAKHPAAYRAKERRYDGGAQDAFRTGSLTQFFAGVGEHGEYTVDPQTDDNWYRHRLLRRHLQEHHGYTHQSLEDTVDRLAKKPGAKPGDESLMGQAQDLSSAFERMSLVNRIHEHEHGGDLKQTSEGVSPHDHAHPDDPLRVETRDPHWYQYEGDKGAWRSDKSPAMFPGFHLSDDAPTPRLEPWDHVHRHQETSALRDYLHPERTDERPNRMTDKRDADIDWDHDPEPWSHRTREEAESRVYGGSLESLEACPHVYPGNHEARTYPEEGEASQCKHCGHEIADHATTLPSQVGQTNERYQRDRDKPVLEKLKSTEPFWPLKQSQNALTGFIASTQHEAMAYPPEHFAFHPDAPDHERVYLRFGDWPADEQSRNNITGHKEFGVSTYDLDKHGMPSDPDPHLERKDHDHEEYGCDQHDEYCDDDCDEKYHCGTDDEIGEYGNDTGGEMRDRTQEARRTRNTRPDSRAHLVKGTMAGFGHDSEPLLTDVRAVGHWPCDVHKFVPGVGKDDIQHDWCDHEDHDGEDDEDEHHTGSLMRHFAIAQPQQAAMSPWMCSRCHQRTLTKRPPTSWVTLPSGDLLCSPCAREVRKQAAIQTGDRDLDEATENWEGDGSMEMTSAAAHLLGNPRGWRSNPPGERTPQMYHDRWKKHERQAQLLMDRAQRFHEPVQHGTAWLHDLHEGEEFHIPLMASSINPMTAHEFSRACREGDPEDDGEARTYDFPHGAVGVPINDQERVVTGKYRVHKVTRQAIELHPVDCAECQHKQAAKDDDVPSIDDLMDLVGGNRPAPRPEKTQEQKDAEEADRAERQRKHEEWMAGRKRYKPGDDVSDWDGYKNQVDWVPIKVAQHFREHTGDQHSGSERIVGDLTHRMKTEGVTDPLMLIHHNEEHVATLGEGNHRLKAMEDAGWSHVPMRVVRMYDGEVKSSRGHVPKSIPPEWRGTHQGQTPEVCKPSDVLHPSLFTEHLGD